MNKKQYGSKKPMVAAEFNGKRWVVVGINTKGALTTQALNAIALLQAYNFSAQKMLGYTLSPVGSGVTGKRKYTRRSNISK